MSDLFHENVHGDFIGIVLKTIHDCRQHTFMILTKRAERMERVLTYYWQRFGFMKNLFVGVTVENHDCIGRLNNLCSIEIGKRFVSFEPLLSEVVIPSESLVKIDLMIVGCESGPNRRFASPEWMRSLRDQCIALGDDRPAFFLKQMDVDGKVVSMPELDGKIWKEWPK